MTSHTSTHKFKIGDKVLVHSKTPGTVRYIILDARPLPHYGVGSANWTCAHLLTESALSLAPPPLTLTERLLAGKVDDATAAEAAEEIRRLTALAPQPKFKVGQVVREINAPEDATAVKDIQWVGGLRCFFYRVYAVTWVGESELVAVPAT